jgi:hypothetical protein
MIISNAGGILIHYQFFPAEEVSRAMLGHGDQAQ